MLSTQECASDDAVQQSLSVGSLFFINDSIEKTMQSNINTQECASNDAAQQSLSVDPLFFLNVSIEKTMQFYTIQ